MVNGKIAFRMEMLTHIIIMVMFIKEIFATDKDKVLDLMFSIKFIDMKVNGKIIHFLERENYLEMDNYFLKGSFKMD